MNSTFIRVAAITGGYNVPSARFRVRQLAPALLRSDVVIREFIPVVSAYPPVQKWMRPIWGALAVAERVPFVVATYGYDVTLLQREMVSTFMTLEPLTKGPRVLDVDDAIFLSRGGKFVERLVRHCESIICGNEYLAENFIRWNENVVVIPTAVDTDKYTPRENSYNSYDEQQAVIGWTGTSGNFKYLYQIENALWMVLQACPRAKLRIIADSEPIFRNIPKSRIEFIHWTPENEVESIRSMTIGIMPLENSNWERGKCSYKMLLYMACGLPVVVSPVGMNKQLLSMGDVGVGAISQKEWVDAILDLLSSAKDRKRMGKIGREVVQNYFSVDVIAPRLANHLRKIAS